MAIREEHPELCAVLGDLVAQHIARLAPVAKCNRDVPMRVPSAAVPDDHGSRRQRFELVATQALDLAELGLASQLVGSHVRALAVHAHAVPLKRVGYVSVAATSWAVGVASAVTG